MHESEQNYVYLKSMRPNAMEVRLVTHDASRCHGSGGTGLIFKSLRNGRQQRRILHVITEHLLRSCESWGF